MKYSLGLCSSYNQKNKTKTYALIFNSSFPRFGIHFHFANRLVDIISKLNLQKSAVVRHMSAVFQPILEKGIVDHSILHKALVEYFTIADKVFLLLIKLTQEFICMVSIFFILLVVFLNQVFGQTSAADVIQHLSSALLVRMIHTKDGSKIGILCIKHGSAQVC